MSDLAQIKSPTLKQVTKLEFHKLKAGENIVILVAGFSFAGCKDPKEYEGRYRTRCINRAEFLLKTYPKAKFKFLLFDITRGTIETNTNGKKAPNGKDLLWEKKPANFVGISDFPHCSHHKGADFDAYAIDPKKAKMMMSITNVYNHVVLYGRKRPGDLIELSFFSHASHLGPILVNSFERRDAIVEQNGKTIISLQSKGSNYIKTYPNKKTLNFHKLNRDRDPQDKDARHRKDFLGRPHADYVLAKPASMIDEELKAFKKAFDQENGMIWVWGCDADKAYYYFWDKLRRLPYYGGVFLAGYKNLSLKLQGKRVTIKFDRNNKFQRKIVGKLSAKDTALFPKNTFTFHLTVEQIYYFYLGALWDTYMYEAARSLKFKTFGAAPGTWSGFGKHGLMEVKRNPPQGDKHKELLEFYTKFLGVKEAPLDLGYLRYPP